MVLSVHLEVHVSAVKQELDQFFLFLIQNRQWALKSELVSVHKNRQHFFNFQNLTVGISKTVLSTSMTRQILKPSNYGTLVFNPLIKRFPHKNLN